MIPITNEAQMEIIMNGIIRDVAQTVADKFYEINQEEIERVVYGGYTPNIETGVYARTGQFKEAWQKNVKAGGNSVQASLDYEPTAMQFNPEFWQHGSSIGGDARMYLADIIYEGITGTHLFGYGAYSEPRDAFRELIKKSNKSLDKWIKDELKKHGLKITGKNITGEWGVTLD